MILRWVALAIIAGLIVAAFLYGKLTTIKEYEPQIAMLNAQLDSINEIAKAAEKRQQDTSNEITKQNDRNIAAIRARYERMLRDSANNSSSSSIAASSPGIDGTGSEQNAIGCSPEFEQACILDANKVTQWQEWARRNDLPID